MPIARLYTRTVSTQRLSAVSGSMKQTWEDNLAEVPCRIHPQGGEHVDYSGGRGAFYEGMKMWCAIDTDILIGDRVIDEDGAKYAVKAVSIYNFGIEANQHKAVMLLKTV